MSNHITGHTGLLCLLGSPVAHSVSPEMHNEACSQLGLDYTYLAFDVPEEKMPQAVEGLRTMGARGWNITMPGCITGKQAVINLIASKILTGKITEYR